MRISLRTFTFKLEIRLRLVIKCTIRTIWLLSLLRSPPVKRNRLMSSMILSSLRSAIAPGVKMIILTRIKSSFHLRMNLLGSKCQGKKDQTLWVMAGRDQMDRKMDLNTKPKILWTKPWLRSSKIKTQNCSLWLTEENVAIQPKFRILNKVLGTILTSLLRKIWCPCICMINKWIMNLTSNNLLKHLSRWVAPQILT